MDCPGTVLGSGPTGPRASLGGADPGCFADGVPVRDPSERSYVEDTVAWSSSMLNAVAGTFTTR